MKKLFTPIIILLLASCSSNTRQIYVDQNGMPDELKGLKIYRVPYEGGLSSVKIGVLNNQVVSTTYQQGKHTETIIMVNQPSSKVINVSSILLENDSIIICRK